MKPKGMTGKTMPNTGMSETSARSYANDRRPALKTQFCFRKDIALHFVGAAINRCRPIVEIIGL